MKICYSLLALCLPVIFLYCQFLWNPVVFDDVYFFDGRIHEQYLNKLFSFDMRWLPYASFEWTRILFGQELIWLHLGNLALHLATIITLFFFLRRLFEHVLGTANKSIETLSPHWLAFFGALIFALYPVCVYAVNYLSQRSILMATLFSLLTWRLFLEGLLRNNYRWLLASVVPYLFAVLSKEHAIMAPTISALLIILISPPTRKHFKLAWPTFVLYGLIGLFVVIQVKSSKVLGQAYEPMASDQFSRLGEGFDIKLAYPLSILTQTFLFFKYLWAWLVPSPAWMSVDIYQHFALRFLSWPEASGFIGFIIYPILAFRLLIQRGINGLFGFGLLCPWLLFATELSTIRIQESFVLYRSYLWMPAAFAVLPFICQKMNAKQASFALLFVALMAMPLSWLRLKTFSHPLLLWADAARLVENEDYRPGMERIYYNRGTELIRLNQYKHAMEDMNKTLILGSENGYLAAYAFSNRGYIYKATKQYTLSLADYNRAIALNPKNPVLYIAKAQVLSELHDPIASKEAYTYACTLGSPLACKKIKSP